MELHPLQCLAFLSLMLVVISQAIVPPELYWKLMLPYAPMPKAVKDLLTQPDVMEIKSIVEFNVGEEGVKPSRDQPLFGYNYAATKNQLQYYANIDSFFLEKNMRPGATLNFRFAEPSRKGAALLPRQFAESIPFSSDRLPEILDRFSAKPGSKEAEMIENALKECEKPSIKGEEKFCTTTLESMIDFSMSKLGKNIRAVSTEVEKNENMQKHKILQGVKELGRGNPTVCHKQPYAYAVFYCHTTPASRAYMVPLEGEEGKKAKAVAICHRDTSAWNPKHLAFGLLNVDPGTESICHFLPQDHIAWVLNF